MTGPVHTAVAIVGGGPVGLLLAAEVARRGVRTLLLEERPGVCPRPKATTLHARTVQSLARAGYLPAPPCPRSGGEVSSPFHFAGVHGLLITAPAGEPQPVLKRPQEQFERDFERRAREAGATVVREHRMVDLRIEREGVLLTADGPRGRIDVRARYVVAADGARSAVRDLAGVPSTTHPATVSAMMGIVRLGGPGAPRPGWHRTPRGWVCIKDMPDGWTHVRTVDCSGAHPDRTRAPELAELRREVERILGRRVDMAEPRWLTRFSDFSRLVRSYRSGRVLLAGDAAHVHFPIGGQGLSTGLLDALNLGWKLANAVCGAAAVDLLDTYDEERRPAAARVIDNVRAQVALMRPDRAPDSLDELPAGVYGGDLVRIGRMISAQDTVVPARSPRPSRWEGRFLYNTGLVTGAGRSDVIRLLRDGRMLLLLFAGAGRADDVELPETWHRYVRVVRAEPVAGLPRGAVLVRPDGYVAWASETGAGTRRALSAWISPARTYRKAG
ncbi:FAD-dependent monooxygenase [Streptomyces sp. NPDC047315]|uniref:FAD-dependent monooxygenase n=1 Tax=Streptomyces sp. NPDC047315 TaxID=3155142 RepID=UPI0033E76A52